MVDTIIPVQEIKRRGMTAVDGGLKSHGAVTIVRNNRPAYVVVSPEEYAELIEAADEARIALALADWRAGRCKAATADKIMREALGDE